MPLLLRLQKLQGNGDGEWKKKYLYIIFRLTRRSRVCGKNKRIAILQHKKQVIACCQMHFDYGPSKMPLRLAL